MSASLKALRVGCALLPMLFRNVMRLHLEGSAGNTRFWFFCFLLETSASSSNFRFFLFLHTRRGRSRLSSRNHAEFAPLEAPPPLSDHGPFADEAPSTRVLPHVHELLLNPRVDGSGGSHQRDAPLLWGEANSRRTGRLRTLLEEARGPLPFLNVLGRLETTPTRTRPRALSCGKAKERSGVRGAVLCACREAYGAIQTGASGAENAAGPGARERPSNVVCWTAR
jgi:hypothetical protein